MDEVSTRDWTNLPFIDPNKNSISDNVFWENDQNRKTNYNRDNPEKYVSGSGYFQTSTEGYFRREIYILRSPDEQNGTINFGGSF